MPRSRGSTRRSAGERPGACEIDTSDDEAAVDAHAHIARLLLDRGELHEALREANRAADLASEIAVKSDLGYALLVQGQVRLALGDIAGARDVLKRALEIHMEIRAGPALIGNTQFQYAHALEGRSPARRRICDLGAHPDPENKRPMRTCRLCAWLRWRDRQARYRAVVGGRYVM